MKTIKLLCNRNLSCWISFYNHNFSKLNQSKPCQPFVCCEIPCYDNDTCRDRRYLVSRVSTMSVLSCQTDWVWQDWLIYIDPLQSNNVNSTTERWNFSSFLWINQFFIFSRNFKWVINIIRLGSLSFWYFPWL